MFETKLLVNNKTGLHARPASDLAQMSAKFKSDIKIITPDGTEMNPKSIISILTAGVHQGSEIVLQIEGEDEEAAGKALTDLINNLTD